MHRHRTRRAPAWTVSALLIGVCGACAPAPPDAPPEYVRAIEEWRRGRLERLQAESGYLSLVGLHWLEPGESTFGTDPEATIVLPEGTAPARAGSFLLEDGAVRLRAEPGVTITLEGEPPAEDRVLRSDADGAPDILRLGRLRLNVLDRGGRLGIRVRDPESRFRTGFRGIESYPVDPAYHLRVPLIRHDEPRSMDVPTVLGTPTALDSPGYVKFRHRGREEMLVPVIPDPSKPSSLWFVYGDATNGEETYGAGRFLYAELGEDGIVDLDFNKSYNPPCAFTPFSTCPIPPEANRLAVRIEAGEKAYGKH